MSRFLDESTRKASNAIPGGPVPDWLRNPGLTWKDICMHDYSYQCINIHYEQSGQAKDDS